MAPILSTPLRVARRARALGRLLGCLHHCLLTGQHYDDAMSELFFRQLAIPSPDRNLEVGSGRHGAQTGAMLAGIEAMIESERTARLDPGECAKCGYLGWALVADLSRDLRMDWEFDCAPDGNIALTGELDMATAPILDDQLTTCEQGGSRTIVLDLRDLRFIDSSGLRMVVAGSGPLLLPAAAALSAAGAKVSLVAEQAPFASVARFAAGLALHPEKLVQAEDAGSLVNPLASQ